MILVERSSLLQLISKIHYLKASPPNPQTVIVYVVLHMLVAATLMLFSLSANAPVLVAM